MEKKLLCAHCRKICLYKTCERTITEKVNGIKFTYVERYGICKNCHHEIFVPEFHDDNIKRSQRAYRDAVGRQ